MGCKETSQMMLLVKHAFYPWNLNRRRLSMLHFFSDVCLIVCLFVFYFGGGGGLDSLYICKSFQLIISRAQHSHKIYLWYIYIPTIHHQKSSMHGLVSLTDPKKIWCQMIPPIASFFCETTRHFAVSGALISMPIFLVSTGLRTLDRQNSMGLIVWGKNLEEIFQGQCMANENTSFGPPKR